MIELGLGIVFNNFSHFPDLMRFFGTSGCLGMISENVTDLFVFLSEISLDLWVVFL